jgi:esterase/lipase
MGGLIATSIAASFGAPRLVLFAPAFSSTNGALAWAPLFAPFLPVMKKGRVPSTQLSPERRRRFEEYSSDDLVLPASQLRRLQLLARGLLPRVESKILVVQGGKDESVPPSVAEWVAHNASKAASVDLESLPEADHVFPFARDASKAAEILKDWVAHN